MRCCDEVDVVFFSDDAYIDHPAFGTAVVGRVMEAEGLKVAIVPQPNWQDDLRDFKKFGKPRMFFAVSAGNMDSMVNHYTANKRMRSDDAYTPDGRAHARPDYTTITYCNILKKLYPDVPIVIGGIEASLRRVTHYDYWSDKLMPTILVDSKADLLVFGMGEKTIREIIRQMKEGKTISELKDIPQTSYLSDEIPERDWETIELVSHEVCLKDKKKYASNFKIVEIESNRMNGARLVQKVGGKYAIINPAYPPWTQKELDATFHLPYTRQSHPKYKGKRIPAYEMIKFSVNLHRGCFGACTFCTISAHQGKFVVSRSKESIIEEVRKVTEMPDFKGTISDLGGPSANMYQVQGKNQAACKICRRPSCIFPVVCPNLDTDFSPLIDIYRTVDKMPGVKHSYIGSGIRYDMMLHKSKFPKSNETHYEYAKELVYKHVSGRLKVAP